MTSLQWIHKHLDTEDAQRAATRFYRAGWRYLGNGLERVSLLSPSARAVAKIPRGVYYYESNTKEAECAAKGRFHCESPYDSVARVYSLTYFGSCPVLVQERLTPWQQQPALGVHELRRKYPWLSRLTDGLQAGFDSQGKLRVYDLGYEHIERETL